MGRFRLMAFSLSWLPSSSSRSQGNHDHDDEPMGQVDSTKCTPIYPLDHIYDVVGYLRRRRFSGDSMLVGIETFIN